MLGLYTCNTTHYTTASDQLPPTDPNLLTALTKEEMVFGEFATFVTTFQRAGRNLLTGGPKLRLVEFLGPALLLLNLVRIGPSGREWPFLKSILGFLH